MGNQQGKHQNVNTQGGKPKKFVHWKSAERPSPPGRPILIPLSDQQPDVITLKWQRPQVDGGSPILGYIIEHRRMGSPHWVRAMPTLVPICECSISGLEPGWRYQFRAIAENIVGKSDPSDLSDVLTVTLQRNAISVPRFMNELTDTKAVENERVELRVTILGQPPPEISWFKDGFEIFSSRRTKIVHDNDVSVLIIHQVALTDEGEIKCTATNRAGHVVTRAKLKVEAPPKIRLPRNYEEGLIVEADEMLRLKVGIAGQPIPQVVWCHEGEMVRNGKRYELVTTEKNSSLKIDNVKREDRGEYQIKAINHLGEDVTSFLVTVTARPKPPGKVKLNMSFGKSATLSWIAPDDDGGCKIGNYIVEYFRIGWNVWLKASTTRQLTTTLHDLIEGSEYKFRVKAENPYGVSDPSAESDVLFIPDPKRGILKPEDKDVPFDDKPVPPKRRTLSPVGNFLSRGGKSDPNAKDASPTRHSPAKINKPELFESEQLNMEMSYGTPDEVVNKSIRKSSSGIKTELNESKHSLSPKVENEEDNLKGSPKIVRRNSLRLEVTEKIQQFFKRSPSPSRKIISSREPSPKDESPKKELLSGQANSTINQHSSKENSPKNVLVDNKEPTIINKLPTYEQYASKEQSPFREILMSSKEPTSRNIFSTTTQDKLSPTVERKIQERLRLEEEMEKQRKTIVKRSSSPSKLHSSTVVPPAILTDNRKSPALQRSEEPTIFMENKTVDQYFRRGSSPFKNISLKEHGETDFQHSSVLQNPTIEISAPPNDLRLPSDTEKRDEVHTSNEFMLVFYPDKKSKDNDRQESFDLDLEEALSPPPISLSTPDMSMAEQYLFPAQIRRSVSSTELLYEKAMARFYEAVEMEEAEKVKNSKLSQDPLLGHPVVRKRLGSMSEAERLSFERRSIRRRSADISQEIVIPPMKWNSKENLSMIKDAQKVMSDKIQRFDLEDYTEDDEVINKNVANNESLEYESDYTESTASDSEESMEKFKMELMARTRSTSGELETYHPRRMSEGNFSPYRSPTPDQSSIVLTKPHPLPSPDFIPKPILKRSSNENVVKDDSGSGTDICNYQNGNTMSSQNNIKSANNPFENIEMMEKIEKTEKKEKSKGGFKSFFKRDKNQQDAKKAPKSEIVLIQEPVKQEINMEGKRQASLEAERKRVQSQKSAEEEAKVVADHYGEIVKDVYHKKPSTPIYMRKNYLMPNDDPEEAFKISKEELNVEESELIARAKAKPRMSIVERLQTQHVQPKSRSAIEKPKKKVETSETEEAVFSDTNESKIITTEALKKEVPTIQTRGRTVKTKKIIVKRRIPSGTRSREQSASKSVSQDNKERYNVEPIVQSETKHGDSIARRRQISKTKLNSESPHALKRKPLVNVVPSTNPESNSPISRSDESLEQIYKKTPEEIADEAHENVRSAVSYTTDVGLFVVACWVYIFKDARLVLPILALMIYRQMGEAISSRIPNWMKRKKS